MNSGRGRPRSETARAAVLAAAGDLLVEQGLAATTIEGIAARAGVSKMTIYKWWPSRGAVVLDGLLERTRHSITIPEGLDTVTALTFQLHQLVMLFADRQIGPLVRAIAGQVVADPELAAAVRERWLAPRRAVTAEVLRQGVARGELRDDVDVDVVMDELYGPLYHRLVFGHGSFGPDLAETLVTQLWRGIALPSVN